MTAVTYSHGWGRPVLLGGGQAHVLGKLRKSIRYKSRTWHDAPPMRAFGRWPSVTHREIHRLVGLGLIALQPALPQHGPRKSQGCQGGLRFTLGVRRWRWEPPRRAHLVRMVRGQLELMPDNGQPDRPKPAEIPKPAETPPPERPRTPETQGSGVSVQSEFTRRMARAGWRGWGPQ